MVKRNAPCLLELFDNSLFGNVLVARELVRGSAHITGSLYVVLSADRIHAASRTSDLADHQRHIGQRHNPFRTRMVLCNAKAVHHRRFIRRSVDPCRLTQLIRVDTADLSYPFRSIVPHCFLHSLIIFRSLADEFLICQSFFDEDMHHAVGKCNVGAGTQLQVDVRLFRKVNIPGIHNDQLRPSCHGLPDLHTDDRMCAFRIRPHHQNGIGLMCNIINGVRHCSRT